MRRPSDDVNSLCLKIVVETQDMEVHPTVSFVIETYNLGEGTAQNQFLSALKAATIAARTCGGEVIVVDVCGDPEIAAIIAKSGVSVRVVEAVDLSYDDAKMKAAGEARGDVIVYLDSDCEPEGSWHLELLAALKSHPDKAGVGGFTRYAGKGVIPALMSVMDFGFLFPVRERPIACYAFNNAAFHRRTLIDCPISRGPVRCGCFAHAQELLRRGMPMILAPRARVFHDLPPIFRERTRQGYDTIGACWANSRLPEARWLRLGILSVPLFYSLRVVLDWKRLGVGFRDLGLSLPGLCLALALAPLLRLLDIYGMIRAFAVGEEAPAWGGVAFGE